MKNLVQRFILAAVLLVGLAPAFAQSPTPVPALPDAERRTTYTLTNQTCACAVNFALYGDSTDYQNWVEVWLNGTQVSYNDPVLGWTITSPTGPIGNIARPITDAVLTFNNPQTGTVQIVGARRPRRTSQFNENAGVSARNLNQVFTDIVAMLREDWDKINDVTGRVILAPPGETMTPLPPAANRAGQNLCFDSSGNPKACAITTAGAIAAGNGINVTGSNPATISANLQGSGPIVIGGTNPLTIGCPTCQTASSSAIVPTRSVAQTENLSALSVVMTMGYSTAGDGGQATYKNVGSAPFIDSFVTNYTITGGSGYTNGGYFGVVLQTGTKPWVVGTATVSGGVVTAVNIQFTPGNQCNIGDVYTTTSIPGGTGFKITVTGCSTPLGSFTDLVGTHWQIITNSSYPNVLQFGCKGDWNGTDTGATDNWNCIQAASWFAGFKSSQSQDAGGWWGNRLIFPQGSYMVCGNANTPLVVPHGVTWEGASAKASNVVMCGTYSQGQQFIYLCDPDWHFACFESNIAHLSLTSRNLFSPSGDLYMVFSNNAQDFSGLEDVYIYGSGRGCLWYTAGYGGASTFTVRKLSCSSATSLPMILMGDAPSNGDNLGSTIVELSELSMGGPSSGSTFQTGPCIYVYGGAVSIRDGHCEEVQTGIELNATNAGNNTVVSVDNFNVGSGGAPAPSCHQSITLDPTNTPGFATFSRIPAGSCSNTITNNQTGGTNFTGTVTKPITCVSGACS